MEINEADLELYEIARLAAVVAYAPYSNFAVGAALRTADGTVFKGVNVEKWRQRAGSTTLNLAAA